MGFPRKCQHGYCHHQVLLDSFGNKNIRIMAIETPTALPTAYCLLKRYLEDII
jgi:hypothetical protein